MPKEVNKMAETRKMVLHGVRASYVTLVEPKAIAEGQDKKYSISLIIEKNNPDLAELKKQINAVISETKWTDAVKAKCDKALRDGDADRPEDDAYAGKLFINAKSAKKPLIVKTIQGKNVEVDAETIYSGCYVNCGISIYAYDQAGNKGVGIGLRGVQFDHDGEPLGSSMSVDEFEVTAESAPTDDWLN